MQSYWARLSAMRGGRFWWTVAAWSVRALALAGAAWLATQVWRQWQARRNRSGSQETGFSLLGKTTRTLLAVIALSGAVIVTTFASTLLQQWYLPLKATTAIEFSRTGAHPFLRISPHDMRNIFHNHTTQDAKRIADSYKGQWIRVQCSVQDAIHLPDGTLRIVCSSRPSVIMPTAPSLTMPFYGIDVVALNNLGKGDSVSAACGIWESTAAGFDLAPCEMD